MQIKLSLIFCSVINQGLIERNDGRDQRSNLRFSLSFWSMEVGGWSNNYSFVTATPHWLYIFLLND